MPPITSSVNPQGDQTLGGTGERDDWAAKTKAGESWGEHHNLVDIRSNSPSERVSEQQRIILQSQQDLVIGSRTPQAFS